MEESTRYKELVGQINTLMTHLLPKKFNPEGKYSEDEQVRSVAFRILAHAEIEAYIEDRVMEAAKTATAVWKTNKKASCTLMGLLAFSGVEGGSPPDTIKPTQPSQSHIWDDKICLSNRINICMRNFSKMVKENHGVKERNLLKLLLPIGIEANRIDQTWLATMDSFGERRGEAAHNSMEIFRTTQQINPEDDKKIVDFIIKNGLKNFDDEIEIILNNLKES